MGFLVQVCTSKLMTAVALSGPACCLRCVAALDLLLVVFQAPPQAVQTACMMQQLRVHLLVLRLLHTKASQELSSAVRTKRLLRKCLSTTVLAWQLTAASCEPNETH
jgi:hypothetical protein